MQIRALGISPRHFVAVRVTFVLLAFGMLEKSHGHVTEWGDSGINGPPYEAILSEMDALSVQYANLTRVIEYGTSVRGRPLRLLLAMRSGAYKERPTLLLTGSTHGNEYLNLEDRLPRRLLEKSQLPGPIASFLDEGGAFIFVPIINPDGYVARSRENAHGVDLNRDWDVPPAGFKGFKEIETVKLRDILESLHNASEKLIYKVTVDYHCCIGALLYPWSYTKEALPEVPLVQHQAISALASSFLGIEAGTTGEVLGYHPLGTTKDYYYARHGALAFTYEGRHGHENKYLEQHVSWWESITDFVNSKASLRWIAWVGVKKFPFLRLAD